MGALALLAHQGGWDEVAIVLGPVIVFLVLRYMGRNAPDAPDALDASGDGEDAPDVVAPEDQP